ncbi:sulfatase-like hydrolase/transferase [bacterium]|nr:sulfatase-like hydrolase/transferase [bacterium]
MKITTQTRVDMAPHPGPSGINVPLLARILIGMLLLTSSMEARKPNVILIYTDDQGSIDLNCYGAKDLYTPHIDQLAKQGIKFSQFYSAAPVCSPSRAAVLTGRFPQHAGVPGNVSSEKGHGGMPAEQTTIAEMMQSAGYATGHIGKWHLGYTPPTMPNGQGFDTSFGHMGGCIDNWSHFFYWQGPNRHDLWRNGEEIWADGQFFPDLMAQETERFIDQHKESPFFLYWAINVPHYPLQATDGWRRFYSHLPAPRRMYAAFVSTMDAAIGQLLASVEKHGLTQDTIIIFQSDHGHSTEARTFGGGGSAGPYRGAKFSLFEGGIRVPSIISWPGKIKENKTRHAFATSIDWFPTIADLCEIPLPKSPVDGTSLRQVLDNANAPGTHEVFHWQTGNPESPQWAVRRGPWKLIGNPLDTSNKTRTKEPLFLSNLKMDISEMTNYAEQYPEIVHSLHQLHNHWSIRWK